MDDQYPRGKLRDDDEGAFAIRIGVRDRTVVIDFGKPIAWFGMDHDKAVEFANRILARAAEIKPKGRP